MTKQSLTFKGALGVKGCPIDDVSGNAPCVCIVVNNYGDDLVAAQRLAQKVFDERAHASHTKLSVESAAPDTCGVNTITMHVDNILVGIFTWEGDQVKNMHYPRYRYMPELSTDQGTDQGTDQSTEDDVAALLHNAIHGDHKVVATTLCAYRSLQEQPLDACGDAFNENGVVMDMTADFDFEFVIGCDATFRSVFDTESGKFVLTLGFPCFFFYFHTRQCVPIDDGNCGKPITVRTKHPDLKTMQTLRSNWDDVRFVWMHDGMYMQSQSGLLASMCLPARPYELVKSPQRTVFFNFDDDYDPSSSPATTEGESNAQLVEQPVEQPVKEGAAEPSCSAPERSCEPIAPYTDCASLCGFYSACLSACPCRDTTKVLNKWWRVFETKLDDVKLYTDDELEWFLHHVQEQTIIMGADFVQSMRDEQARRASRMPAASACTSNNLTSSTGLVQMTKPSNLELFLAANSAAAPEATTLKPT